MVFEHAYLHYTFHTHIRLIQTRSYRIVVIFVVICLKEEERIYHNAKFQSGCREDINRVGLMAWRLLLAMLFHPHLLSGE